jgi:hypothetical protein
MPAISSCELKEVCDVYGLRLHITTATVVNLTLPDHRHRLIASQCSLAVGRLSKPSPALTSRFIRR